MRTKRVVGVGLLHPHLTHLRHIGNGNADVYDAVHRVCCADDHALVGGCYEALRGCSFAHGIGAKRQRFAFARAVSGYGHGIHGGAAAIDGEHSAGERIAALRWVCVRLFDGDIPLDATVGKRKRRGVGKAHVHRVHGGIENIAARCTDFLYIIRSGVEAVHAAVAPGVGGDGSDMLAVSIRDLKGRTREHRAVVAGLVDLDAARVRHDESQPCGDRGQLQSVANHDDLLVVVAGSIPSIVGGAAAVVAGKGDTELLTRHTGGNGYGKHIPVVAGEAGYLHAVGRVAGVSAVTVGKTHPGLPDEIAALLGHIDRRRVDLYRMLQRRPVASLVEQIHRIRPHGGRRAVAAFRPCVLVGAGKVGEVVLLEVRAIHFLRFREPESDGVGCSVPCLLCGKTARTARGITEGQYGVDTLIYGIWVGLGGIEARIGIASRCAVLMFQAICDFTCLCIPVMRRFQRLPCPRRGIILIQPHGGRLILRADRSVGCKSCQRQRADRKQHAQQQRNESFSLIHVPS